jgi:pantetheine-phosphate adenylyltransferase
LIRGVRQISDFEYEFRMALTNRRLAPEVDTVFLMPDEQLTFISASVVKEIAAWGGDLSSFVPEPVATALRQKFNGNSTLSS